MTKQQEQEMKKAFLQAQTAEMESATIYKYLANKAKNQELKDALLRMASNKGRHAGIFKKYTKKFIQPKAKPQFRFRAISTVFGMKMSLNTMLMNEQKTLEVFKQYAKASGNSEFREVSNNSAKHVDMLQKFIDMKAK